MSSPQILFVGAGRIGLPIIQRMIARGLNVVVSDSSAETRTRLSNQGANVIAPNALQHLTYSRVVLCLPEPDAATALLAAWTRHDLPAGTIVADITTMSPSTARQHAEMLAKAGGTYLDAPVTGGQRGADSGDMVVMASGRKDAFDGMHDVFHAIGSTVHYAGDVGTACLIKAINQYVYLSYNLAFAHGLALGRELGLADDILLDVLSKGAAAHPLINDRLPSTLGSGFREGFLLKRCLKDLDCLEIQAARETPSLSAYERLRDEIRAAVEGGLGDRDILILSRGGGD